VRVCQVPRLKPGHREEHIRAHANIWPEIKQLIHEGSIRNYSLDLKDDLGVFDYIGDDMAAD